MSGSNTPSALTALDHRKLFEGLPALYAVLLPDFTFVNVSDAYLQATMTVRERVVGRNLFEVFPDNPNDPNADGATTLRLSLEYVRKFLKPHAMDTLKYDIRRPDSEGGHFEERYWRPINSPILNDAGELQYILIRVEDVTASVRHEQLAIQSQNESTDLRLKLAAIVESSRDAIIGMTVGGTVTSWNSGAEAIFGYSTSEMVGRSVTDLFPVGATKDFHSYLQSHGETEHYETTKRRKDGQEIIVSASLCYVRNAQGEVVGISKILRDVTATKRAERDRAILEMRATAVLNAVNDGILVIDEAGVISTFNVGAERIFGRTAQEVIGKDVGELMEEPDRSEHRTHLDRYKLTSKPKFIGTTREVIVQRRDGKQIPTELSVTEMRADGKRYYTGVIRDIRERKEAESELANINQELQFSALIDRIGAHVILALNQRDVENPADEVLRILAADAGYGPIAYYEYDEWKGGMMLAASLGLAPTLKNRLIQLGEGFIGEAALRRKPSFMDAPASGPFPLDSGEGTLASTVFAVPLVHREKLLGVIAGSSPGTLQERERSWLTNLAAQLAVGMHALQQFQQLKLLSAQLNERSQQIEEQNRELAQANRLKSEFLASMSHELRTPLNAIIGFSEALKDGLLGELPSQQLEYVAEVFQSGKHLLSLINDILDLSKIEAGKLVLEPEAVEVLPLVSNALTIVRERAAKGGVRLEQTISCEVGAIYADGRRVRQILYNLLSNAVKFTNPGGSVHVSVTKVHHDVEFSVIDTGIGISEENLARLFQPFQQLDAGIARKFEGTGLGLVMVKNLVELHGGTFGVSSEFGQGSKFWFRIRATRDGEKERTTPPTPLARPTRVASSTTPTILVVDDDPAAISLAQRWLEKAGFVVNSAQTCADAWEQIARQRPDAILLDILYREGAVGWQFLERVRSTPELASVPVVVVSIVADLGKGLSLGALDVLQKPVAGLELLRVVESLGISPLAASTSSHVLVVDDDPRSLEYLSNMLENAGLRVTRAHNGNDAMIAISTSEFSAIVLDLLMPEMSGFAVLTHLRRNAATIDLPVVVSSAMKLDPAEQAELDRSVYATMIKGQWSEQEFLQTVRGAIHQSIVRRSEREARTVLMDSTAGTSVERLEPQRKILIIAELAEQEIVSRSVRAAGFAVDATELDTLDPALIAEKPLLVVLNALSSTDIIKALYKLAAHPVGAKLPVMVRIARELESPEREAMKTHPLAAVSYSANNQRMFIEHIHRMLSQNIHSSLRKPTA